MRFFPRFLIASNRKNYVIKWLKNISFIIIEKIKHSPRVVFFPFLDTFILNHPTDPLILDAIRDSWDYIRFMTLSTIQRYKQHFQLFNVNHSMNERTRNQVQLNTQKVQNLM